MRAALATAELDEADHQGLLHELLISAHLSASQRIAAASRSRQHQDRGGLNYLPCETIKIHRAIASSSAIAD